MEYYDFKAEMWSAMYHVRNSMHKVIEPVVQSEGLSMIQAYILFTIEDDSNTNISSLSKVLGINQGNLSTMCKNMEKMGLIKRTRSSEDERVVTLSLTEQGKAMIVKLYGKSEQFDAVFEKVPKEKLQTIIGGMQELNELLKLFNTNL